MNANADRTRLASGAAKLAAQLLRRLHADDRGASTTEYLLITVTIVLPIALAVPLFLGMVRSYVQRFVTFIGWPFP